MEPLNYSRTILALQLVNYKIGAHHLGHTEATPDNLKKYVALQNIRARIREGLRSLKKGPVKTLHERLMHVITLTDEEFDLITGFENFKPVTNGRDLAA